MRSPLLAVASCAVALHLRYHVYMSSRESKYSSRTVSILILVGFLLLSLAVASSGAAFPPGDWYAGLKKPSWTPPAWLFGPVWTLLYIAMAVAAWQVWRTAGWPRARAAFVLYGVQMACNAAWSWLFFGLHRMDLAFYDIVALWLAIAATFVAFWRIKRSAGLLLAPYLAWVGFAMVLNLVLWRLNV